MKQTNKQSKTCRFSYVLSRDTGLAKIGKTGEPVNLSEQFLLLNPCQANVPPSEPWHSSLMLISSAIKEGIHLSQFLPVLISYGVSH